MYEDTGKSWYSFNNLDFALKKGDMYELPKLVVT